MSNEQTQAKLTELKNVVLFAYEMGYHDHGYDIVDAVIGEQLAAAQKRVAELEDLLASARAQINNLASSLSYLDSRVNEFASVSASSSFRMANIADAKTVYNKIDAVLTEPSA